MIKLNETSTVTTPLLKGMRFEHQIIDLNPGHDGWGASLAADFDGDGRPEFVTGGKGGGFYFMYDYNVETGGWDRKDITNEIEPNVGAACMDLDGDGKLEIVCGSWCARKKQLFWLVPRENADEMWECISVAEGMIDPHDILAGDVDGDGEIEIVVRNKNIPNAGQ